MNASTKTIPYEEVFAAQAPVLGTDGQERLRHASVHVVGAGRIGSMVALHIAGAGVGTVSINDRQTVESDNSNSFAFTAADIGQRKVVALGRWLESREHFNFQRLALPVEEVEVDQYIEASDLVICCANTVIGRISAEKKAVRYDKPSMQVAVFDGRDCLGGLISVRLPENPWAACGGCYLDPNRELNASAGLLSTVTSTLAAIATNMAAAILSDVRTQVFREKNLFYVDLETYGIEALAVEKRSGCPLCGQVLEINR